MRILSTNIVDNARIRKKEKHRKIFNENNYTSLYLLYLAILSNMIKCFSKQKFSRIFFLVKTISFTSFPFHPKHLVKLVTRGQKFSPLVNNNSFTQFSKDFVYNCCINVLLLPAEIQTE